MKNILTVAALVVVGALEASAQTKPDTTKPAAPTTQTKQPAPPAAQTKTPPTNQSKTTPPATQSKAPTTTQTKAPTTTQTKAPVTPPAGQTKAPATPPAGQTKAPATPPAGQTKAATPPATQQTKAAAPQTQAPPPTGRGGTALNVVRSDTAAVAAPLVMMREVYEYDRDGRRDPFISLLATTDLRPTLSDLRLLMTVVDEPGRSVALVADAYDKKQKTLRVGTRLGRMRVSSIRADVVVFTIEEFGMNRRDSLLLRDSTKVRGR